jgi:ketosteroid isomerase-like protein
VRGAEIASLSSPLPAEPERVSQYLTRALSIGNLDAAAACFARDACLITPDGTAVHGRERIRPVLAQLILARAKVAVELSSTLVAGDVALTCERWTIRSPAADGKDLVQSTDPTFVLRWIEEEWKLALVAPWGWR